MILDTACNKQELHFLITHNERSNQTPSHLIGLGLDNKDGHKRLTQAEHFTLVGGSEETHEKMTETVCRTVEDLKKKGRTIQSARPNELQDLLDKNTPS